MTLGRTFTFGFSTGFRFIVTVGIWCRFGGLDRDDLVDFAENLRKCVMSDGWNGG
ncbi:hypothetical protein BAG01nite_12700 [Brevibacillus agri]|uniref:Uncharacterized protein n=1 Tax=Brevibacillus agri TaxID=51101 RepID=A0ABQ0SNG3_9BACL|nr:hypothetical protein BAG01nite_12700 [Brevibacillus agri]